MRKRLFAALAITLVTLAVGAGGSAYISSQTRTADAAPLGPGGAWAEAPQVMPLMARPVRAVVATQPAAPPDRAAAAKTARAKSGRKPSAKTSEAQRILRGLIRKHPILRGATVKFGQTRSGAQAEAFYKSGRIVVNPNHRASLVRILTHETWHVIDWRDNGRIDWGERVPPAYSVRSSQ